ncbi:MAG: hypothetical protein LBD86_06225, partial [Spirochaetaceae bacterium]|nr:hypothetical protein [Spirochaetaceae bacterium]
FSWFTSLLKNFAVYHGILIIYQHTSCYSSEKYKGRAGRGAGNFTNRAAKRNRSKINEPVPKQIDCALNGPVIAGSPA